MVKAFGLDEQDMPIIELVAQGYSNQEIADKVKISASTRSGPGQPYRRQARRAQRAGVALRASDAGLLHAWPSPSRGTGATPIRVASDRSSGDGEPFREHRPVAVGMLRTE